MARSARSPARAAPKSSTRPVPTGSRPDNSERATVMSLPAIPFLSAPGGARIPAIGFGTSQLGDCAQIVATALKLGYRHIDTAWKYGSEKGVGEGIKASGVAREEIFLVTKVSH